jgi:hypothetical protein
MAFIDAKKLTPTERILAMEALWESMCQEEPEPSSPAWHEQVLAERRARVASGEVAFLTLQQLRQKLGR